MIDDKEIIADFCIECDGLFSQLEILLEDLEGDIENSAKLEKFGQIIDRAMGAAKALEAEQIAAFCELGKIIGYKSSQVKDMNLRNVVVAVLFDTVDLLKKMIEGLKTGQNTLLKDLSPDAFVSRLKWLSEKFKDIERASVSFDTEDSVDLKQENIDDLMKQLGL